jgi:hypothetical protein
MTPALHSFSNSREQQVKTNLVLIDDYYVAADYGLDKLELHCLIKPPRLASRRWHVKKVRRPCGDHVSATRWINDGPAPVRASVRGSPEMSTYDCFLSFNPSRFVDPNGIALCRPSDVSSVIGEILEMAHAWLKVWGDVLDMEVRRVDVARNFYGVTDPSRYLLGLAALPRRRAQRNELYRSAGGQPETLRAGSSSGGWGCLYDKGRESPDLADPGTMRFEI